MVRNEMGSFTDVTSTNGSVSPIFTHSDPFRYDHYLQTIDTDSCGLGIRVSPEEISPYSSDNIITSPASDVSLDYYLNRNNWPEPRRPTQQFSPLYNALPETVRVSPFTMNLPFEGAKSNPELISPQNKQPQNKGWDFVKVSPTRTKQSVAEQDEERSLKFLESYIQGGTTDTVPSQFKNKAMKGKKGSPIPSLTSTSSNESKGLYSSKQGSQSTSALSNVYHDAKEIYMAGPKGEGHILWNGIQQLYKQRKATEQGQPLSQKQKPRPPPRPMPPAPLGVTRTIIVDEDPSSSPSTRIAIPRPPARDIQRAATPFSWHTSGTSQTPSVSGRSVQSDMSVPFSMFTIQVGASPRVQQDAQETIIDYTKPRKPQAPLLLPAPKTKEEARRRSGMAAKRGLPPPPVPVRPRVGKGNYVVIGADLMQGSDKEKSGLLLPVPNSQLPLDSSIESVGSKISIAPSSLSVGAHSGGEAESTTAIPRGKVHQHLAGLDDRVTERPRQRQGSTGIQAKQSWISRLFGKLCNVHDDDDCHSQAVSRPSTNKKSRTKQANISKLDISYPRPMHIPQGESTANIAVMSGGVGGPAAAVSLSREEEEEEKRKKLQASASSSQPGRSQQPPERSRSVPPGQRTTMASVSSNSREEQTLKKSKSSQNFWSEFVSPVVNTTATKFSGSSWVSKGSRKRNDSDASFGCQGITMEDGISLDPGSSGAVRPCPTDASSEPHAHHHTTSHALASSRKEKEPQYRCGSLASIRDSLLVPLPLFSGRGKSHGK